MLDEFSIDAKELVQRLPPGTLGLFESVSGVLFMNVADADFEKMRQDVYSSTSNSLLELFHHESYHCFQSYCTGYQFRRMYNLVGALGSGTSFSKEMRVMLFNVLFYKGIGLISKFLPHKEKIKLSTWSELRLCKKLAMQLQQVSKQTGQVILSRAFYPKVYQAILAANEQERKLGTEGISALDVIEGAAVMYARASVLNDEPNSSVELLKILEKHGDTYTRAFQKTVEMCGERASEIFLPATALALRYDCPGDALLPIIKKLLCCPTGQVVEYSRKLAKDLPDVGAGEILGTAAEYAARLNRQAKWYNRRRGAPNTYNVQLMAMASGDWGIDEIDLLTDPLAINAIPVGALGFSIMTRESRRGMVSGPSPALFASIMLGGGPTIPQRLREIEKRVQEIQSLKL